MYRAFEGHIIRLLGSNRVCRCVSQRAVYRALFIPDFVFVMTPKIVFMELAVKIVVLITI